jgi:hypothetical protein
MSNQDPEGNNQEPAAPSQSSSESMWGESGPMAAPTVVVATGPVTSSSAIVALVLSILAWPVCPVIFAIIALVFASKADKEIVASQGRIGGSAFSDIGRGFEQLNPMRYPPM